MVAIEPQPCLYIKTTQNQPFVTASIELSQLVERLPPPPTIPSFPGFSVSARR